MTSLNSPKIGGKFHPLTTLEKKHQYTLLLMSGLGIGANAIQFTLEDMRVNQYAQYEESVQLIFKLRGKRKLMATRFHGDTTYALWVGWVDLDTNAFEAPTLSNGGLVCRSSRYSSFDKRYLTDAIASATVPPLFSIVE